MIGDVVCVVPHPIGAKAGTRNDKDIDKPESTEQDPLIVYAQVESRMNHIPVMMEVDFGLSLCAQSLDFSWVTT
jgi:hypothetical protein